MKYIVFDLYYVGYRVVMSTAPKGDMLVGVINQSSKAQVAWPLLRQVCRLDRHQFYVSDSKINVSEWSLHTTQWGQGIAIARNMHGVGIGASKRRASKKLTVLGYAEDPKRSRFLVSERYSGKPEVYLEA